MRPESRTLETEGRKKVITIVVLGIITTIKALRTSMRVFRRLVTLLLNVGEGALSNYIPYLHKSRNHSAFFVIPQQLHHVRLPSYSLAKLDMYSTLIFYVFWWIDPRCVGI